MAVEKEGRRKSAGELGRGVGKFKIEIEIRVFAGCGVWVEAWEG